MNSDPILLRYPRITDRQQGLRVDRKGAIKEVVEIAPAEDRKADQQQRNHDTADAEITVRAADSAINKAAGHLKPHDTSISQAPRQGSWQLYNVGGHSRGGSPL